MESLLINLGLCLIVLFMPVLLMYGSAFVYANEYCKDVGPLVLLNILLAIAIVSMVADRQISTFTVMAVVGYGLVAIVIIVVVTGSLVARICRRIQIRSQLRMIEFREEQSTLSQSFLPY